MSFDRVELFGFPFTRARSVREVAEDIMVKAALDFGNNCCFLITPNASTIVYYSEYRHRYLKQCYAQADYVLADGVPIVLISRLPWMKELPSRLPGSDLFPVLWQQIIAAHLPVTMVLSTDKLAGLYESSYEGCRVIVPGYFQAGDEAYIRELAAAAADQIVRTGSRFLFLGLNFPKQEKLGLAVKAELKRRGYNGGVLILLLGASFEFYFGLKSRAPQWMQRTGLEWLYRFACEPRRLWKRYTIDNLRFLAIVLRELFTRKKKAPGGGR